MNGHNVAEEIRFSVRTEVVDLRFDAPDGLEATFSLIVVMRLSVPELVKHEAAIVTALSKVAVVLLTADCADCALTSEIHKC